MTRHIILHKNTLLRAGLSAVFLFAQIPLVSATVVTSMKSLGFIAAAIADGVTDTQVLLSDGTSECGYPLRPSDVKRLQNADLMVRTGPGTEALMDRSMQNIAANKKVTIAELEGVEPLLMAGADDDDDHDGHDHGAVGKSDGDHHHGIYNMHLWLSPEMVRLSAAVIHDKSLGFMPQSRVKLDSSLQQFEVALVVTDKQVSNELAPLKGKGYLVFHDAYGYFEKHYGLTSSGRFTVNPEIQPGAQRPHEIKTQLVEQRATCVFAEPQFRSAVIEVVARGTSVRIGILGPLGTGITLGKASYPQFPTQLTNQYSSCLKGDQ